MAVDDILTVPAVIAATKRFLRACRVRWRLFGATAFAAFAACQAYFFAATPEYQSRVILLPYVAESKSLGSLGGLGALAGVALPQASQRAVPPEAYADLLRLPSIRDKLAATPVRVADSVAPAWRHLASALEGTVDSASFETYAAELSKRLAVTLERRTGFITVAARAPEAKLAAGLAAAGAAVLSAELVEIDRARAEQQAGYTSGQLARARRELDSLQGIAIDFLESNRVLVAPSVAARKRYIDEQVAASERIYWDLAGQYSSAMMRQAEESPVFTVVDTARVPRGASWPREGLILVAALLLAALGTATVVAVQMASGKSPVDEGGS